ncbi:MAG: hypothetical protein FWB77_03370 [Treponema sp.]|nr:hypothetical protein [Treponema sp.]
MANNKLKYLLLAFIFLVITAAVTAQDEPRLTQRFSWSGGEYAFRYEVIFEQMVNNNYVHHSRYFITQRFIEVSLTIGDYRFRVIPYDILDKPSRASEWKNFKIIPAPKHEPDVVTELEFVPDYELEPEHTQEIEPEVVDEVEPAEKQDEPEIEPEPEVIKNPYALKKIIFSVGAFASMQFPLYSNVLNDEYFPVGFGAHLSVLFNIPLDIYIGLELTANFHQFYVENYNLLMLAPGANILAIKWIASERIALGLRLGAMYMYYSSDSFSAEMLLPNIGVLFRWRITPFMLLEGGVDYFHIFGDASGGNIRPWIGAGIQL